MAKTETVAPITVDLLAQPVTPAGAVELGPPLTAGQLAAMEQELAAARSSAERARAHGRPVTAVDLPPRPPAIRPATADAGTLAPESTAAATADAGTAQPRLLPSGGFLLPAGAFRGIEGLGTDSPRHGDAVCAACGCADFERTEHVRLAVGYGDGQRFGPVFRCLRCGEVRNAREVLEREAILRQNAAIRARRT